MDSNIYNPYWSGRFCVSLCILFLGLTSFGQNEISLEQVLNMGQEGAFRQIQNEQNLQIAGHDYAFFTSTLKPLVSVNAMAPNFFKTSTPVRQPNGSILFQPISQNDASLSLSVTQEIAATGTSLFFQSDLQRFDDFTSGQTLFNGIPFRIGIIQPIIGYNATKWNKKMAEQTFRLEEKRFIIAGEQVNLDILDLYFAVLLSDNNRKIASQNLEVNEQLLQITTEKVSLGKASEDELLQIRISRDQAAIQYDDALLDMEAAKQDLGVYLGDAHRFDLTSFTEPPRLLVILPSEEELIDMAIKQSDEIQTWNLAIIREEAALAQANADFGIQMNLVASYGTARGSDRLSDVYLRPLTEQQINLTVSLPLVDWGRKKHALAAGQIRQEQASDARKQVTGELINRVRTESARFRQLQQHISQRSDLVASADKRFNIANERYRIGAISIMDLVWAQREKDLMQQDYIRNLHNMYRSYFRLRQLTGGNI